jgi:hypothetical protein
VDDRAIVRLSAFRPVGHPAILDATLRDDLLPRLVGLPGLAGAWLGRQGSDRGHERHLVTLWQSRDALRDAMGDAIVIPDFDRDHGREVVAGRCETLPVAISLWFDRPGTPQVLRIFHGEVRDGELDRYVEDAKTGTLSDASTPTGPLGLFLGVDPPARFVTISVWTDWSAIEATTGGNIHRPVATRHGERLTSVTADHYEILGAVEGSRPQT